MAAWSQVPSVASILAASHAAVETAAATSLGPAFIDYVGGPDELASLVGRADVVINAAPLTPQITGLFNAAMFNKMKRTALFINAEDLRALDCQVRKAAPQGALRAETTTGESQWLDLPLST
jgi:lactate dehydrogenase-like 2-hydroxyacid dehydrogenase